VQRQPAEGDAAILAIRWQLAQPFRMTDRKGQQKTPQQRRAEALRANLRRRKAQAKGRSEGREAAESAAGYAQPGTDKPHDSAGIGEDK
jgi:hypothetical protein